MNKKQKFTFLIVTPIVLVIILVVVVVLSKNWAPNNNRGTYTNRISPTAISSTLFESADARKALEAAK